MLRPAAALLLWLNLFFIGGAQGQEAVRLDQVRIFAGEGHARLLLVFTGAPGEIGARSSPPIGAVPGRAVIALGGVGPGPEGARTIPVREQGVEDVRIEAIGADLQVTVEVDEARMARAWRLNEHAVLVDLIEEGRGGDPTLPTEAMLRAWVEGASLVRASGGRPRGRRLVVLDAGHGGFDHGAVSATGTREADVALQITLRAKALLVKEPLVDVILTREDDSFIPLQERAAIANRNNADLFLSVHVNSAPGPTAWGIETYSLDTASDNGAARVARRENQIAAELGEGGSTDQLAGKLVAAGTNRLSKDLAIEVQSHVLSRLRQIYLPSKIRDLGTKTALFYVLVSTRMPAILFETSFLSNPEEERRLRTPHFQQAVAEALVESVRAWFARQGEQP